MILLIASKIKYYELGRLTIIKQRMIRLNKNFKFLCSLNGKQYYKYFVSYQFQSLILINIAKTI